MHKKLTPKEDKFCYEFVRLGNKTEAYRVAYYCDRMKPTTIRYKARDLIKKDHIRATIDKLQREERERLKKKYQVNNDRIIQELHRIAFADIGKLFDENGKLRLPNDIDEDTRLALKSIEVVTRNQDEGEVEYHYKFRMLDKLSALEKLARILGMYEKNNLQNRPVTTVQKSNIWEPSDLVASLIPNIRGKLGNHSA